MQTTRYRSHFLKKARSKSQRIKTIREIMEAAYASEDVFLFMCIYMQFTHICDRICENRPPSTRYQNRDSAMNDVIEVWSRSGGNLETIAYIVLEIQSLEARRVG